MTCVAKLTDPAPGRWDRALQVIGARQLTVTVTRTPARVGERRIIYVSKTRTCVAKLTDRWDRALISARQLTPVGERRIHRSRCVTVAVFYSDVTVQRLQPESESSSSSGPGCHGHRVESEWKCCVRLKGVTTNRVYALRQAKMMMTLAVVPHRQADHQIHHHRGSLSGGWILSRGMP